MVIIVSLERQLSPGVIEFVEQFFIQQLITRALVFAFDEGVLLQFFRVDIVPVNIVATSLFQDRTTAELRPVVADNASWLCVYTHQHI